jgi:hypothetical protein
MFELLFFAFIVIAAAGVAAIPFLSVRLWRLHHAPASPPLAPVRTVVDEVATRG